LLAVQLAFPQLLLASCASWHAGVTAAGTFPYVVWRRDCRNPWSSKRLAWQATRLPAYPSHEVCYRGQGDCQRLDADAILVKSQPRKPSSNDAVAAERDACLHGQGDGAALEWRIRRHTPFVVGSDDGSIRKEMYSRRRYGSDTVVRPSVPPLREHSCLRCSDILCRLL